MIYLKHLSVKHRQFGDTEFTVLSGAVKTGCSFSSDKTHIAILSCSLLWIWCGKALLFTWLRDKQSQTSKVPWTHKNILSSLTAGAGIICHTGCLYLETCVLQATADKKKDILCKQKYCCPKLMITVLPGLSHSTVPEKYSNLHTTVCFQMLFPSAQSPLLVKIAEASAFGSNYISFSPSSATGHEVFLPQLQMRPFVFLYFFGVIWWRAQKKQFKTTA